MGLETATCRSIFLLGTEPVGSTVALGSDAAVVPKNLPFLTWTLRCAPTAPSPLSFWRWLGSRGSYNVPTSQGSGQAGTVGPHCLPAWPSPATWCVICCPGPWLHAPVTKCQMPQKVPGLLPCCVSRAEPQVRSCGACDPLPQRSPRLLSATEGP